MSFARRVLFPGALIAIPVAFAAGSIALAQVPSAPNLPEYVLEVPVVAPVATPKEVTPTPMPLAPAPVVVPAPAPAPVPAPVQGSDDDDNDND